MTMVHDQNFKPAILNQYNSKSVTIPILLSRQIAHLFQEPDRAALQLMEVPPELDVSSSSINSRVSLASVVNPRNMIFSESRMIFVDYTLNMSTASKFSTLSIKESIEFVN